MLYVFENNHCNASVVYDDTTLTSEQKAKGIAIAELPIAETPEGKQAILKCKMATSEVWYEYEDITTDTTDQRIVDLEIAMAALMGGAA